MLNKKVTNGEVLEESDLEPVSAGLSINSIGAQNVEELSATKLKVAKTAKSSQKLTKQSEKAAAKVAKVAKNADKVLKVRALDKGL